MASITRFGTVLLDGAATVVMGEQAWWWRAVDILGDDAPTSLVGILDGWDHWSSVADAAPDPGPHLALEAESLVWLPPVMPRKLICIGANYGKHNAEMLGDEAQPRPYSFLVPPTTTLVGSMADVPLPTHAKKIDYEVELAVVIGRRAKAVSADDALSVVFGYSILNDISARDWVPADSFMGMDWVIMKSFDRSAPMGPWITAASEVSNPQALDLSLTVNDDSRQKSNTADMVFSVAKLIEHLSSVMTLEPGDVIATGTPEGTAFGNDDLYLRAGDIMRAEITGLGVLVNQVSVGDHLPVPALTGPDT